MNQEIWPHGGGGGADIFRFERGDGLWPNYPTFPPTGHFDNIVWDYQDGIDKFDVPDADFDPAGLFGPLFDKDDFNDPVIGAIFSFGDESVAAPPNVFDPLQNTTVFVKGVAATDFDAGDFI